MKGFIKLALFAGAVGLAAKMLTERASEWRGLTEAEVRDKLDRKIGDKVPADKRAKIADTVVGELRRRGMVATTPGGTDGDGSTEA